MLKVAGVTFEKAANYGSRLQAYALQYVIEQQTIRNEKCSYSVLPLRDMKGNPRRNGLKRTVRELIMTHYKGIVNRFEKKYMHYANCRSVNDLVKQNDYYDAFVCGSDVIWSPYFNDHFDAYYLTFAQKYAFSYAASFGRAALSEKEQKELKEKLSHLRRIGVRETTGKDAVAEFAGRESQVVLDPTLLMKGEDWNRIISLPKSTVPYIFVYFTHYNDVIDNFIKKIQAETGYKVFYVTTTIKDKFKYRRFSNPSPQKWLGYLRNADYVVTNSFHATAISLLLHKKFFTVVKGEKNGGINIRMHDLLTSVGMENRLYNTVPEKFDFSDIDYTKPDERLEELRKESLTFLCENLEAAYEEKSQREQKGSEK